ncbi:hypothetical protein [Cohnella abietis]|uniref:hypothetical protein n=1 Tax=Cohnella abietis TaxID=2507935 RepID=UPI0011AE409E|nr:hypothetical protein [Cohnella abietis]
MREPLFNPDKHPSFTLTNYFLRDYNDSIADLDKSKQIVDRIISGGKVVTSALETFAAQAVSDINNPKSEVIYDPRGTVLLSKVNPNDIVVLSSKGLQDFHLDQMAMFWILIILLLLSLFISKHHVPNV